MGGQEVRDPTLRGERTEAGWPWRPMTPAYDSEQYEWGFGRTFFARDLKSGRILWLHDEVEPVDSRGGDERQPHFFYCGGKWLGCLDALEEKVVWRNSDADLLTAIGPHGRAQNPQEGFSTTAYMKSSDKAVFFAGPPLTCWPRRPRTAGSSGRSRTETTSSSSATRVFMRWGTRRTALLIEPLTGEVKASEPGGVSRQLHPGDRID